MKNKVVLLITLIVCFFLQCTLVQNIAIGSIVPNLLIIFVVSMGLMRGQQTGLFTGFLVGLLADLFYGDYLGIQAFLYMIVGYFSGFAWEIYYDNNIKVPMMLAAGGDFLYNIGDFSFRSLLRANVGFTFFFRRILVPELIYTVILTAIVYRIFYLINHRFMKQKNKERESIWLLK